MSVSRNRDDIFMRAFEDVRAAKELSAMLRMFDEEALFRRVFSRFAGPWMDEPIIFLFLQVFGRPNLIARRRLVARIAGIPRFVDHVQHAGYS